MHPSKQAAGKEKLTTSEGVNTWGFLTEDTF